jgi:hypothetical protein
MTNQTPKVKDTKQHYRIWFEYFKIAKFHGTKEQKANLKKLDQETGFYSEWEPITLDTKFDDWWKEKKHLFGDSKIKVIDRLDNDPRKLNISIPLTESVTKSISDIRELIDKHQANYWKDQGIRNPALKKNRRIAPSIYKINGEIKGQDQHPIQLVYKLWIDRKRPPINSEFLDYVENWFRTRPKSKWLPKNLQPKNQLLDDEKYGDRGGAEFWDESKHGKLADDQNVRKQLKQKERKGLDLNKKLGFYETTDRIYIWSDNTIKVVRRQIKDTAEKIVTAVSKGRFPK